MHLFISYSKLDSRHLATRLRSALNAIPGLSAWMDEALEPADSWATQIQEEIDRCDLLVVLLSPDVNRSTEGDRRRSFVLNEIDYAQQENKDIIPVMAHKTKMPVQLAGIQYADLTKDDSGDIEVLVDYICKRAGVDNPRKPRRSTLTASRVRIRGGNQRRWLLIGLSGVALLALGFITGLVVLESRGSKIDPLTQEVIANSQWSPLSQTFNSMEMMLVPKGCFQMGSIDGDTDEAPVSKICFDQPFWIGRYEVTNAAYGSAGEFGGDDYPREEVSWFDAKAFCERRDLRLPTEAEWEYAARGPSNLAFPWGNNFDPLKLNFCDSKCDSTNRNNSVDDGFALTAPVGHYANTSWVGAYDLSGNVLEWVSTIYDNFGYPYKPDDGREDPADLTSLRGIRGGSWYYADVNDARSAHRRALPPGDESNGDVGFRCARSY